MPKTRLQRSRAIFVKCALLLVLLIATTREGIVVIQGHLAEHRPLPALAIVVIWIVCVACTWCVALLPRLAPRVAWAIILGLAGFVSHAYFAVCKTRLDWFAFETLWSTKFMAGGAASAYGPTLVLPALLALSLAALIASPPTIPRLKNPWLALLPLIPAMILFQVVRYTDGRGKQGMPSPYNTLGLLPGLFYGRSGHAHFPAVTEDLKDPPRARNILFLVDESIRYDYIDLNRDRGITPFLKSLSKQAINFGSASSAANCSASSNAILRLGAEPAALTSGWDTRANPAIWQYARKAGFKSIYIGDQATGETMTNYMYAPERALIDEFIQDDGPNEQRDMDSIPVIVRRLREPGRHFIYVNKAGAHFPYQGYPKAETIYSPTLSDLDENTDRVRMINSYKNAIRWNVDTFFKRLNEQADLSDTLVIYTSDHGQNLLDDGVPVTHCRTEHPISEEAWVPLLVFSRDARLASDFRKAARLNHDRASAFQIFPTLLRVMGYDPVAVRKDYYPSLFDKVSESAGFVSGGIFRMFGSETQWNAFRFYGKAPATRS